MVPNDTIDFGRQHNLMVFGILWICCTLHSTHLASLERWLDEWNDFFIAVIQINVQTASRIGRSSFTILLSGRLKKRTRILIGAQNMPKTTFRCDWSVYLMYFAYPICLIVLRVNVLHISFTNYCLFSCILFSLFVGWMFLFYMIVYVFKRRTVGE